MLEGGAMTTAETWIAAQDPARSADLRALHELISRAAPDLPVGTYGKMLGYGPFHYRYPTGTEGDTFLVAVASGKTGISVYVNAVEGGLYLPERHKDRLGKANIGKSCIRFKKLADL